MEDSGWKVSFTALGAGRDLSLIGGFQAEANVSSLATAA